jgi:hypothetical protein
MFRKIIFSSLSMRKYFRFLSFIAALAAFGLNGCKSSLTSPSSSSTSSGSGPTTGSSFTYVVRQYDISGFDVLTTDTVTATVSGTQSSFEGEQNVVQFSNGDDYVYESNGDVSIYLNETQPYGGGSEWVRFPFSGDAGTHVSFYSGDSASDGITTHFVGPGPTLTAGSKEISTEEAESIDTTAIKTSNGGSSSFSQYNDYYFAPQIGAMTEIDVGWYTNMVTNAEIGKKVYSLIGFTIK